MALRIPADCMRSPPYELAALADQDRARGHPLYKLLCLRKTRPMTGADEKQTLHRYLRNTRGVLLWKLEGLSGYDIRRPVTPTGTNLLGLVKHCAGVECGYFGAVMDRPFPGEDDLDWHDGDNDELTGDMYATAAESREQVTDFYRRCRRTPMPRSGNSRWTHTAPCPGGPRSAGIPPCTRCSCTRSRKPPGTPGTRHHQGIDRRRRRPARGCQQ